MTSSQVGSTGRRDRRYAVVTGAGRGLGLALCEQLVQAGFTVIGWHRGQSDAAPLRACLAGAGADITVDVSDPESIRAAAADTDHLSGGTLAVVVNNAGIGAPPGQVAAGEGPLRELRADALHQVFAVNTVGPMLVTQALAPCLARASGGTVVNISSDLGSITRAAAGGYAYAMSKAALNMLTRKLADELRPRQVTVVALHPGSIRTRIGGPHAELSARAAAHNIVSLLDRLGQDRSGEFLDAVDGTEIAW